jgi:DNA-binding transcriptional LysR family regulator
LLLMDLRALSYFVAVAEERNFGRAAARLHMTQPPLSRAIKQLETELGAVLLDRSSTPLTLTSAGTALYDEARLLLDQAEHVRARVAAKVGTATLTIGILADSAEQAGTRLAAAFRRRHPGVQVVFREADFSEPTAGLRAGLADVAITLAPFDDTGISTHVLRTYPMGVVLRTDDPLARRGSLRLADLADRRWFRLPDGTDPIWRAYWEATAPGGEPRDGPVVRTVHECLQAVLWNGSIGLAPLIHELPDGLTAVPLADMPPSRLIIAWSSASTNPLIRSFTSIAAGVYHRDGIRARGTGGTALRSG